MSSLNSHPLWKPLYHGVPRTQIKLWAVVKLQRFVRRYMLRMKKRKEGRIKMMETRERWRKKIEGPNYLPPPPPPAVTKHNGKR